MARLLIALPVAVLLAAGAVRAMTFAAPNGHPLRSLESNFRGHPDAAIDRAMTEIGAAAARGQGMPPTALTAIDLVARKAPLSSEPFLVRGTLAQMSGNTAQAESLFKAARDRNPRSQGARYFLAERYLQTGRILPGLIETSALARLSEQASQPLVPALVAYARTPGAIEQLRRFFVLAPELRDRTLSLLATDSKNAPLVLALMPDPATLSKDSDWPGQMVRSMVIAGDYAAADAMWKRLSGVTDRGLLYNRQFRDLPGPPPFNWAYASANSGVAEPSGKGGLDVIYYGRESVTLAAQTLRLAAGRYRLSMQIDGPTRANGLAWMVFCYPGPTTRLQLPIATVEKGVISGDFEIPASGCIAQSIELRGQPPEVPETAEVSIFDLTLAPIGTGL